ncbi:MAG TPA: OmpA family protein [Bosea sp. (in: a-proteobacteria)]|jgi:outer membrane protein OmpA-like peptidoglycan-associated protein|uniref:OmpA family protein n=1 Tax=Bosea sp. (in: a-proteobacteria) TaxID=1871050 RepID=UPI002E145F89|nr:OmpA family protein [Bosea sp. (in: a-proteobacteria)]
MARPGRWLWGLIPLTLLWSTANLFLGEAIERDVGHRAAEVAAAVAGEAPGARPVTAQVEGRDVTISGEALSADGATRAIARLRSEFGVRRALGGLSQVVAQRPYSWSAMRQGDGVSLNGFVPDEATAVANVAAVRAVLPAVRIDDRQSLAFGAPAGFQAMTQAVLAELPGLAAGKIALDDSRFCIEGRAATSDGFLALTAATTALARDGFQSVPCALEPPVVTPYRWGIEYPSADALRLTGFYPSEAARQQILGLLRRAFPGPIGIDDRTKPAAGEPAAFLVKVTRAIGDLARLREGKAELTGDAYVLSGDGPATYEACQALRLQIAQGDGPDSVAQAAITCPPEPPPPPPVETLMPPLPDVPAPIFLPSELPAPPAPPAPSQPTQASVSPAPAVNPPPPPPPPPPVDLSWSAAIDQAQVALKGLVRDAPAREALLEQARRIAPSGVVSDQLLLEPNLRSEPDYGVATGFALELLGKLRQGSVTLAGAALALSGEVANAEAWHQLDAALRRPLPAGLTMPASAGAATVPVRPYVLSLAADRTGITLSGYLPDAQTREALQALVEASPLKDRLTDETQILPGAPAGFAAAARMALGNLLRLDFGSASIADDVVTLRGLTCRDLIKSEVETSAASGLPPGFRADAVIGLRQTGCVVDPPATCQNDLDALTKSNTVLFAQGTTVVALDAATERVIGEAVDILKQCPDTRITIEGHANSDGHRKGFDNLDLSARRALRVRDELVRRGVDANRLETRGFGFDRPLVPHGAAQAKSMNRRVQFTVAK